jgi:hypothetical protein
VITLFDNPDNLPKWQRGLQSFELIGGKPGQSGAKSRLRYDMDGPEIEMIETIQKGDLPEEFSGTFEADGVWNWVSNRFHEEGPEMTRWEIETNFKFSGLMRILALFMRGSFPKQTRQLMESFKEFAESHGKGAAGFRVQHNPPYCKVGEGGSHKRRHMGRSLEPRDLSGGRASTLRCDPTRTGLAACHRLRLYDVQNGGEDLSNRRA